KSTTITPPTRLHNYFQVMLWHRCISDLITLYNRIQSRHVEAFQMHGQQVNTMTGCDEQSVKAVCCQDPPLREKEPSSSPTRPRTPEPYPFCCKAHSLVFTTQYPLSFVPYSLRVQFRRMVHKVQSVSQKKIWSSVSGWREQLGLAGRTIQYTGSTEKLQFCTGTAYPPSPPSAAASEGQLMAEEEALVQRRYRIEEQARQDNLDKQELLALCHMACGLFLADDRLQSPPPTIISLLRQGSPWNKGVWCEGEWQHASIDVRQPGQASLNGSSQSAANSSSVTEGDKSIESGQANDNGNDMGRWQSICIAAIQFLAHEDLAWGGNRTNAELSRLRAANNPSAWTYHE
ncbi:hypothetical protein BC939DRAFT_471560, partial [Gamsiella multidivaricata]|uniref:uncharacterized protein n=1 Tax=Gamsiella multidivaricata TaxID=101098 RepID=UPI0022207266